MWLYESWNLVGLPTSVVGADNPEIILLFDFHAASAVSARVLKRNSFDFIDVAHWTTNKPRAD